MAKVKKSSASDWFVGKARTAAEYRKNLVGNTERLRGSTAIGKMYCFYYDPKHKDKLQIYDRFPLVFPIDGYEDGFLGLNLHYLSVPERRTILNELKAFASNPRLTPQTRLNLSYSLLQNTTRLDTLSRPCIKRYLTNHIRSRFVEITPDEWDKVIELPTQDFVRKK
jgi:hypothetical protein